MTSGARPTHGAEYIPSEAAAQKAAAPESAAPSGEFPLRKLTSGADPRLSAVPDLLSSSTDSTARLLDLCTRRRLAWLDERRLWERVSFLVEDDPYFKPTAADVVADAAVEWQAAAAVVRGLDASIALEVAARRMDVEARS